MITDEEREKSDLNGPRWRPWSRKCDVDGWMRAPPRPNFRLLLLQSLRDEAPFAETLSRHFQY